MKPIKMLGLAVMAALLAMAFAGASSAMATTTTSLCKAMEEPCAAANQVSHVHETSVGQAILLGAEVKCDVLFLGDVTGGKKLSPYIEDEDGTILPTGPLSILGAFSYSNCNGECTIKEENGPTEIQVLRTGTELATVTIGSGAWVLLLHVICFIFKISCSYVAAGLEGHAFGSLTSTQLNGSVTFSEQKLEEEGSKTLCTTVKLDITTTPLEKTYIST